MLNKVYYITKCDKKLYDTNKHNYTLKTEGYKRRQGSYSKPVLLCVVKCADNTGNIIK